MDWNDLKAFEAVAQAGSLTEAARRSGMSIATLSRRLDNLERTLGLKLVQRGAQGAELSPDGQALIGSTSEARNSVDAVLRLACALRAGNAQSPVRVSATETVITTLLAPNAALLNHHTAIELIVSNKNANLYKREADIAVRLARPAQETLIARRLASVSTSLYVSAAYLNSRKPQSSNLGDQTFILYSDQFGEIPEVVWARKHGLADRASIFSSSTLAILNAVVAGTGIGLLPDYLAEERNLHRIDFPAPPPRPLWLVFHKDSKSDVRMRAVRQWIVECVRAKTSRLVSQ